MVIRWPLVRHTMAETGGLWTRARLSLVSMDWLQVGSDIDGEANPQENSGSSVALSSDGKLLRSEQRKMILLTDGGS